MKKTTFLLLLVVFSLTMYSQSVSFTLESIGTASGSSVGVVDMNGDFLDDILIPRSFSLNILHQQSTNDFSHITIPISSTNGPDWSISVADYDKNGMNDIMFGGASGVSFLKANANGTSFLEDYSSEIFIFSQRTNFVDINNDGNLDAFVCHDVDSNVYFLNDGNGSFSNEIQGGIGDTPGGGNYGSLWFDYDDDGDMDLYISKCKSGSMDNTEPRRVNQLHRNNGDGTFTNIAVSAGVDLNVQSWSTAVGDFDNDGDMDLIVADQHVSELGTKLMRNNGDGTFSDQTLNSGFINQDGAIEIVTFDFNNDGFLDIYSTLDDKLLLNNGNLTFSKNTYDVTGGGAIGDLNNDGFLDIFTGSSIQFNDGNDNNWFKLNLEGVESNRNGIGAKITIEGNFGTQVRQVRSGEGFWNMHSLNPHFGLGNSSLIETLIVEWPSGVVDVFSNVSVNQTLFVREGSTLLSTDENDFNNSFVLHPVPANDFLSVRETNNSFTNSRVVIYDVTGRKVKSEAVKVKSRGNINIDVRNLNSGIYFIEIEDNRGRKKRKRWIKR